MSAERAPIFDDVERTDVAPSGHGESTFDFLNRVAGEYWLHPRQLMQIWADQIPDPPDYSDLRQRFRSHDDEQFRSAFLELYLHECLTRAGYRVTIHPSLPATTRRPDFHAERAGAGFYLEAIDPGASPEAKAAAGRRAVLFDIVNRLGDPNFLLWLSALREGPGHPHRHGYAKTSAAGSASSIPTTSPTWRPHRSTIGSTTDGLPPSSRSPDGRTHADDPRNQPSACMRIRE